MTVKDEDKDEDEDEDHAATVAAASAGEAPSINASGYERDHTQQWAQTKRGHVNRVLENTEASICDRRCTSEKARFNCSSLGASEVAKLEPPTSANSSSVHNKG